MNEDLASLYREAIRRHRDQPCGKKPIANADSNAFLANPLCGDEVYVYLKISDNRIEDIGFQGESCAICQASASMMAVSVAEASLAEAARLAAQLIAYVRDESPASPESPCPDLPALEGVKVFPARLRCATLPWEALQQALQPRRADANA